MPSLQSLLKQRITTALTCGPPGVWKTLIVDDYSKALVETVYKLFDILHMNIAAVDMLMSPREPQPSLDAVYLLTPTTQNVQRILADFHGRRTYRNVHLYFIDGIDDKLAEKLTDGLGDICLSFVELYCNFWPIESQVFSLKSPSTFFSLFGNPGGIVSADLAQDRFEEDVRLIGRSMVNLLATLGENPLIRYYQPHHHPPLGALSQSTTPGSIHSPTSASSVGAHAAPTPVPGSSSQRWKSALGGGGKLETFGGEQVCRRLAVQIQSDLDQYKEVNPEFAAENPRPKSVLFVVDRSMDPFAPFLHEFTYQAMVNDLLPVEGGTTYKYKSKTGLGATEQKTAILTEEDSIWTEIRHMHMKEAIDKLMGDFNRFTQEHANFQAGDAQATSLNDMKDMLASLPQFQEKRDKFALHLDMANQCMEIFGEKKLSQSANVEQCCATGVTAEGKTPKSLVEEMVPILAENSYNNRDKVRIIALYILHREGVPDEDRKRLFQHARLSLSEQEAVNNLVYLGCRVVKSPQDRSVRTRYKSRNVHVDDDYELSRYRPLVRQLIEDQVANKLDPAYFPYLRDAPQDLPVPGSLRTAPSSRAIPTGQSASLRSARPTWHKAPSARVAAQSETRQRIILFVAGGLTYSEQRLAYLVGNALNKDVIIGSTHNITPEGFVNDLKAIGRAGIGGNPPNAKPNSPYVQPPPHRQRNSVIPYQYVLDTRIWSEPVGPPSLAPPPPPPQQQQPNKAQNSSMLQPKRPSSPTPSSSSKFSSSKFSMSSSKKEKKEEKPDGQPKKKSLFGKLR